MKFINCGPAEQFATLQQAVDDMAEMHLKAAGDTVKESDFLRALGLNEQNANTFVGTDLYKNWVANGNYHELEFQALAKHYCRHAYHGHKQHPMTNDHFYGSKYDFMKDFC